MATQSPAYRQLVQKIDGFWFGITSPGEFGSFGSERTANSSWRTSYKRLLTRQKLDIQEQNCSSQHEMPSREDWSNDGCVNRPRQFVDSLW